MERLIYATDVITVTSPIEELKNQLSLTFNPFAIILLSCLQMQQRKQHLLIRKYDCKTSFQNNNFQDDRERLNSFNFVEKRTEIKEKNYLVMSQNVE